MHLVAAPACISDLEPGALLLLSRPLRSAVTQLTCNRLAVADRQKGAGAVARRVDRLDSGSTTEMTAPGSPAEFRVSGGMSRTGDVTAGGANRN